MSLTHLITHNVKVSFVILRLLKDLFEENSRYRWGVLSLNEFREFLAELLWLLFSSKANR